MNKKFRVILLFVLSFSAGLLYISNDSKTIATKPLKDFNGPDQRPSEWAWEQRTFPNFTADPLAHYEALKQAQLMRKADNRLNKKTEEAQWEFAGPVNIGGRISDIEFNPLDANIVYAGASTGGVFKSTDKGLSWFPVFDDQAVLPIGDIAVDPVNPDIVYAGTGEPNGSHNNFPGAGIFKSTDAGETWFNIGLELTAHIGRIVIDPLNTDRLFAAAVGSNFDVDEHRGIYRSTDAGTSWEKVLFISDSTGGIDVALNFDHPDTVYATMWERVRRPGYGQSESSRGPSGGVFRSFDGGDSWVKLGPAHGLPEDSEEIGRIGLAVFPADPSLVLAYYNDGATYTGLYRTQDNGETWTDIDPFKRISGAASTFSWYFGQIRVHPEDKEIMFAGEVYLARTSNDGGYWDFIGDIHVDHHALAFAPDDPDYIISGNDGGMNISTDCGLTWSPEIEIPITQFYEINIDMNNPERLFGGTQDNNTIGTFTGELNDWQRLLGGDGFYVNIDYTDPDVIYAEWQNGGLAKSVDGGETFYSILNGIDENEPTNWSTPVVMDPINPQVLYYGTNRLYKTTNGGNYWNSISPVLAPYMPEFPRFQTLSTIAVSISNTDVIVIGTDNGKVWVTPDGGSTWNDITEGLPLRWVSRVAIDPDDENIIYATFSGLKWRDPQSHVFRSTDMGQTWTDISSNLPDAPVNAFAIDYNNTNVLYLGSDVGVFVSFNAGQTWEPLFNGIPVVSVYDLKIHPVANYLVAGTHGRSMYKLDLNKLVGVENRTLIATDYELKQNYPNPFNPTTTIRYTTGKEGNVTLKVYNSLGQEIKTLVNGIKIAGSYAASWNGTDNFNNKVASGVYIYRLEAEGINISKKMTLMK